MHRAHGVTLGCLIRFLLESDVIVRARSACYAYRVACCARRACFTNSPRNSGQAEPSFSNARGVFTNEQRAQVQRSHLLFFVSTSHGVSCDAPVHASQVKILFAAVPSQAALPLAASCVGGIGLAAVCAGIFLQVSDGSVNHVP